jgi:hypothetical protein
MLIRKLAMTPLGGGVTVSVPGGNTICENGRTGVAVSVGVMVALGTGVTEAGTVAEGGSVAEGGEVSEGVGVLGEVGEGVGDTVGVAVGGINNSTTGCPMSHTAAPPHSSNTPSVRLRHPAIVACRRIRKTVCR